MKKETLSNTAVAKKACLMIICVLLCAVSIVSAVICLFKVLNEARTESYYREIDEFAALYEDDMPAADQTVLPYDWPFDGDVAAWIVIPCLDISYPVMYSADNEYYQHRDINGEYAFQGSLFIDMYSGPDFAGSNTVIYGHNMLNGTMFGRLWHIVYRDAARDDPYFWIITEEGTYRYRIFSAFETTKYSEGFKQFEPGSREFLAWCTRMKDSSCIDTGNLLFSPEDRIVTLATCGSSEYYRTLVMGVRA